MKKLKSYLISFGICLVLTFLLVLYYGVFKDTDRDSIFISLINAFFIPGLLMVCFGLLIFVSNEGIFDIIIYGVNMFINKFRRDESKRKYKTFYDYKIAKGDNKFGFGFLIITGLVFILISVILLIIS